MESKTTISLVFALFLLAIHAECNFEGDALYAWRTQLNDPNNVLQSWDPTLVNPCTWFHITCNIDNSVTRVDLGNAGLSGPLAPQLGLLGNLQYLYVNMNNLSGAIPSELGNLTSLIQLSLSNNKLSGSIPSSLGYLRSLRVMSLNGNSLSGRIPETVIQLVQSGSLQTLNVSDNRLEGTIRKRHSLEYRITTIIQDPRAP